MTNKKVYTGKNGGKYTLTKSGEKSYLPKKTKRNHNGTHCGSMGGAAPNSFPVNSAKRCSAALSYSRFAKRPCGIVSCALRKAAKKGWKCGTSSMGAKKCGCNSVGRCSSCKGCK